MGRHSRRGRPHRHQRKPRGKNIINDDGRDTTEMYQNALFEEYYKNQGIVPEEEWDAFIETLKMPLPSAFRITRCAAYNGHDKELLEKIKGDYLAKLMHVEIDGKVLEDPIKCHPWYPDQMAWQFNLDRRTIRRHDQLSQLHKFLVQESESGAISRQESVSMIPPLVMDIKPHHKVLDMCAAPGSKTAQLVEALHANGSCDVPDGIVIANDVDNKRCYLLTHEVKRLASPCFMVTNHDATLMPNLRLTPPGEDKPTWLNYDRVLCDVPCSGDGTLRKNGDIWAKWNTRTAHNLHGIQARILKRGLEALDVGGRLVYSTCSMNPVEDEAVISAIITKCKGAVQLVDVSKELPGLKYQQGLHTWRVMSKKGEWFDKHEDVPKELSEKYIRPNFFPPSIEVAKEQHLERCIRVLPHQQNTGGFFVAVLEKKEKLFWHNFYDQKQEAAAASEKQTEAEEKTEECVKEIQDSNDVNDAETEKQETSKPEPMSSTEESAEKQEKTAEKRPASPADGIDRPHTYGKKKQKFVHQEDPFIYLEENESIYSDVKKFYGISDDFPMNQLLVRCQNIAQRRKMYFTNKILSHIVQYNKDRVKVINLGVRCFERSSSKYTACDFRLGQDGMNIIERYQTRRKIFVEAADIIAMCNQECPFLSKMTENTQKQLIELKDQGSVCFVYEPKEGQLGPSCRIVLGGWLGKTSCRTFLPVNDRAHFLRLCGAELLPKKEGSTGTAVTDADDSKAEDADAERSKSPVLDDAENSTVENADEENVKTTKPVDEANGASEVKTEENPSDGIE